MKPRLSYVLVGALATLARTAPAAEPGTLRLTLDEAVERALAASATLGQFRSFEQAAEADLRGARAERIPQVDVGAGYLRASNVPELTLALPGSPPRTIFPNIPDNYRARLGVAVPVYTGGRLGGLIDAAAGEKTAAGKDVQTVTADLTLEVRAAYWALVTARDALRVVAEAVDSYEAHWKDALNRERFGMAARSDVLAVQVERDRAELGRLRAENAAAVAAADLARLLGLPPGTEVEAAEPLEHTAPPPEDVETLVAAALQSRPERAALAARVEAAEARVRAERGAYFPQVTAAAGYDYANPNRRVLPQEKAWKDTWDVSLNLSVNVFDGGRTRAAVSRASALTEALRWQLADFDRHVRLEVTRRALDVRTSEAAIVVAERAVEAARENVRVSAERYREGVLPSSELLDAEQSLLTAGLDRTQALAAARVTAAALLRAQGR